MTAGDREVGRRWEAIEQHLPDAPFTSLDVGCAEGWMTAKLAERGEAVGIDSDSSRFRHASNIVTAKADAAMLRKFLPADVVLLLSILHHMPDGMQVFQRCRENARVLFVELPHPSEQGVAKRCKDIDAISDIVWSEGVALVTTPGYDHRYERTLWKL